jgi:hypothetical protein
MSSVTIPGILTPPLAASTAGLVDGALSEFGQLMSQPSSVSAPSTSGGIAILCARGTTLLTNLGSNSSEQTAGYYAIEEWVRSPIDNPDQNPAALMPVLFTGVAINHRDVYSQMLCLNNIKVIYSFGQNFGDVTITGEILLGNFGEKTKAQDTVKAVADFFWKNRVSNSLAPVTVSAVAGQYLVYLVGMDFGDIIPEFHIVPFVLHGVLLDISRTDVATINASSKVKTLNTAGLYNTSIIAALSQTTSVDTSPGTSLTPITAANTFTLPAAPAGNAANNVAQPGVAVPNPLVTTPDTGAQSVTDPTTLVTQGLMSDKPGTPGAAYAAAVNKANDSQAAVTMAQNLDPNSDVTVLQAQADADQAAATAAGTNVTQAYQSQLAQQKAGQRIAAFKYGTPSASNVNTNNVAPDFEDNTPLPVPFTAIGFDSN